MRDTIRFTDHGRMRANTRGFPPLVIEMILDFGESRDALDGARKYALTKSSIREIRRYAGHNVADELNRYKSRHAYVVASSGRVITTAYADKPVLH
jgi:hypothetical protein